jgi:hypothetical protein
MARDHAKIGFVLANIQNRKADGIESFSKGLEILEQLEKKTGYRHPFNDTIQGYISQLQKEKEPGNLG